MKLSELITDVNVKEKYNYSDTEITGISYNSKTTKAGDIFVCLIGEKTDGHKYAQMAQNAGACAILAQSIPDGITIPVLIVKAYRMTTSEPVSGTKKLPHREMPRPNTTWV